MYFNQLTELERDIVRRCMIAILEGPYIPDWEFQTRLGIDRSKLRTVLDCWPSLDDSSEHSDVFLAINNCLNEVCNGVSIPPAEWSHWFDVAQEAVEGIFIKWAKSRWMSATGIR